MSSQSIIRELPTFDGYTVDERLRQFRKVNDEEIEFVEYDSDKGQKLLRKMLQIQGYTIDEFECGCVIAFHNKDTKKVHEFAKALNSAMKIGI